jgi:hypothetical protein
MADSGFFNDDDDDEFLLSIPLERPAATPFTPVPTNSTSKTFLLQFAFGEQYVNKFDEEGYDEIPNLYGITVQQLKTELNMKSGHANRLHRWLKKRNHDDEQDDAADKKNLQHGLHLQQPARKKRRTSISSSVSSAYMAPEMKVEDSDDDDDDHDDHDDGNDEDDDDDDCEIISSTQFTQPQSQSSSSNYNAAVIHRQHHHRHQSTPAKTPKKRRMPVRTPPPPAARQLSFGRRTTRFPDRAIRTLLDADTCDFVRPKDNVRIYLEIPYEKKDFGKSLGARFDWGKKKWYVMSNHDAKNGYDQMRHLVSLFGHDNSKYPFDE